MIDFLTTPFLYDNARYKLIHLTDTIPRKSSWVDFRYNPSLKEV